MIGMTLCSGIGAPELAAPWVDWRFASEIEAFPRAVLQKRFGYHAPEDHNQGEPLLWGDMTEVTPDLLRARGTPLPDLIVAGTPCQAFSVAGLRKGTADARGNLTLKFVEILHAIVDARPTGQLASVWENVPGILSDKNNAFGCFLGGIVGAVDALVPGAKPRAGKSNQFWKWVKAGKIAIEDDDGNPTDEFETVEAHHRCSWPSEGMVSGPRARAAWGVLDAQWFGVAQRRRRLFVVIDFGNCIDPAAVLLEPDSLRGNTPPRRETGQDVAASLTASTGGCSGKDAPEGRVIASEHPIAGTVSSKWAKGSGGPAGDECQNLVAYALRGEGFDASEDGTGRGTPIVPVAGAICRDSFTGGPSGRPEGAAAGHFVPVAFDCKGTEVQFTEDGLQPTLRSMGHLNGHQNAGGHAAIAIQERATSLNPHAGPDGAGYRTDDTAYTLEARIVPQAVAFQDRTRGDDGRGYDRPPAVMEEITGTLETVKPWQLALPWAVRRLTPTECNRLQGMPDDHTRIKWRGRPANECPDGPQYKGIGNSMAVPVMRWILDRVKISYEERKAA